MLRQPEMFFLAQVRLARFHAFDLQPHQPCLFFQKCIGPVAAGRAQRHGDGGRIYSGQRLCARVSNLWLFRHAAPNSRLTDRIQARNYGSGNALRPC